MFRNIALRSAVNQMTHKTSLAGKLIIVVLVCLAFSPLPRDSHLLSGTQIKGNSQPASSFGRALMNDTLRN
jgi:hypothetical protein